MGKTFVEDERPCDSCVNVTRYGCVSWNCEYINRDEAIKAWREKHEMADRKTEATISKMEQVDEPQTEPLPKAINGVKIADAVAWADKWLEDNPVSEMWDMIRTLRDATEWQDEPQTERSE